jgi:hypothetical protein
VPLGVQELRLDAASRLPFVGFEYFLPSVGYCDLRLA